MDKGELVPDDLMINLLKAETQDAPNGWLIDGMPRTPVQAKAMNKMGLEPDLFFTLEVPDSVLADRITLRRMDPVTGEIYNLKLKPPPPEIKSRLTQRKDDTLPKLQTRLGVYHKNLDMVKEIYKETNNLKELDGVGGGIDGVHSRLLTEMLKDRLPG
jgi:adenylate kinase